MPHPFHAPPRAMPRRAKPFHATSRLVPRYAMPCHAPPRAWTPCHAMPCPTSCLDPMPCHAVPRLVPCHAMQYHSGSDLETPGGSMQGSFQARRRTAKCGPGRACRCCKPGVAPWCDNGAGNTPRKCAYSPLFSPTHCTLPPKQMAVVDPKKPHAQWLRTFDAEVAPFRFIMPGSSGSSGSGGNGSGSSSSGGGAA